MHADWLTEWGTLRVHACLQGCAHPLHQSERERERERERGRDRESEKGGEWEMYNMVIEFISFLLTMAALQIKFFQI